MLGSPLPAAAPRSSRPGPGGRRCARRDSWPGPCAPASVWSRRDPPRRRRGRASAPPARSAPSARATSSASTAGASASYIVLSSGPALPRSTTPPSPARRAAASSGAETVSASPRVVPIRRKRVPNSGPLAPPTVDTRVMPTLENSAPGVAGGLASSAATAAFMPRSMFDPWSASPIAASSSVRWSRFSATRWANLRTHSSRTAVVTFSPLLRCPISVPTCSLERPRERAARHRP